MTKKQPKKKAARAMSAAPVDPQPAPPTEAPVEVTAPPAPTPRPVAGRMHRATLTPAGLRGRDLVRFLRIHSKKPYGARGEEAIRKMAVEVGHLGNAELNSRSESGR